VGCFYLDTSILLNLEAPQNSVMQMPFPVFPRLYVTESTPGKEASAFNIHQLQEWTPSIWQRPQQQTQYCVKCSDTAGGAKYQDVCSVR